MFTRLRHGAVNRGDHENGAVHLRRTRDHVLHIIGVARAVNVCVVTIRRLVFNVRRRDGQNLRRVTTTLRFRCFGDLVVRNVLRSVSLVG